MKATGIELIAAERAEQIEKHGRTIKDDKVINAQHQLSTAASRLCNPYPKVEDYPIPFRWESTLWQKMLQKSYKERLIIAGALIAAEIDRLQAEEEKK